MSEQIALVLHDGPADEARRLITVDFWPPPEFVKFPDCPGGYYQRIRYSQLDAPSEFVMRGGEYRWVPEEPGAPA